MSDSQSMFQVELKATDQKNTIWELLIAIYPDLKTIETTNPKVYEDLLKLQRQFRSQLVALSILAAQYNLMLEEIKSRDSDTNNLGNAVEQARNAFIMNLNYLNTAFDLPDEHEQTGVMPQMFYLNLIRQNEFESCSLIDLFDKQLFILSQAFASHMQLSENAVEAIKLLFEAYSSRLENAVKRSFNLSTRIKNTI
jgi:hypothetical protein